jgi:hypothetical protein
MTRRVTLAVALATALALAACGDDRGPTPSQSTLTFTEQETENFGFADNAPATKIGNEGPQELSNGDQLTFSSELLDGTRADIGDLEVSCTITRPGDFDNSHLQCAGTATLPHGTLTLARGGRVFGGANPIGSIVGGTGSYAGATGEFTESEENAGRTRYTFRVQVPEQPGGRSGDTKTG